MSPLTPFEFKILEACVKGSEHELVQLQAQAAIARVSGRKHTVVGEYVDLFVPDHVELTWHGDCIIGDVNAEVEGVEDGVHVLLWVRAGKLECIEFATNAGVWPDQPRLLSLGYFREESRGEDCFALIPSMIRDAATLDRALRRIRGI